MQRRKRTYVKEQGSSIVDITLVTSNIVKEIQKWRVVGYETRSDHNYIRFKIYENATRPKETTSLQEQIEF